MKKAKTFFLLAILLAFLGLIYISCSGSDSDEIASPTNSSLPTSSTMCTGCSTTTTTTSNHGSGSENIIYFGYAGTNLIAFPGYKTPSSTLTTTPTMGLSSSITAIPYSDISTLGNAYFGTIRISEDETKIAYIIQNLVSITSSQVDIHVFDITTSTDTLVVDNLNTGFIGGLVSMDFESTSGSLLYYKPPIIQGMSFTTYGIVRVNLTTMSTSYLMSDSASIISLFPVMATFNLNVLSTLSSDKTKMLYNKINGTADVSNTAVTLNINVMLSNDFDTSSANDTNIHSRSGINLSMSAINIPISGEYWNSAGTFVLIGELSGTNYSHWWIADGASSSDVLQSPTSGSLLAWAPYDDSSDGNHALLIQDVSGSSNAINVLSFNASTASTPSQIDTITDTDVYTFAYDRFGGVYKCLSGFSGTAGWDMGSYDNQ